jgi:hypothetical protein
MVYVNALMIQDVLTYPDLDGVLTAEDERGLTPLFWSHGLPYGEVMLNMNSRLTLGGSGDMCAIRILSTANDTCRINVSRLI